MRPSSFKEVVQLDPDYRRDIEKVGKKRESKAERYAKPENLAKFAEDLLGVTLHPNQLEWHDLLVKHRYLLIEAAVGHGKSYWLYPEVVQYICRETMHGNGPRVLFVTGTERMAKSYTQRLERALTKIPAIQDLYGPFGIGASDPWTTTEFRVVGAPTDTKEPTWFASGPTPAIEGTRATWGILDDFINLENAKSAVDREAKWAFYTETFMGRLDEGAPVTVIGSSWHPEDAYSTIRTMGGYDCFKYPAIRDKPPYGWGRHLCPEMVSPGELEEKRAHVGETRFQLRYLMNHQAMMRETFDEEWITYIDELPEGIELGQAWDFAITSKAMADARKSDPDFTACATLGYDPWDDKLILAGLFIERVDSNHYMHIKREWERWNQPRHVYCETNAFQQLIMEMVTMHCPEVPVVGVKNTSIDKVTRILSLQKYFQGGWKIYRGIEPETLQAFIREYTRFPLGAHDDALDAMQMIAIRLKEGRVTSIEWDI